MIDLQNLIDFFPYYFKENDSYKVDSKGLLERFLNICGDYFQQYPLADIDSFLENLDVNKTNIIFVNNFWKFFGELPFAQGPIIDPEIFSKAFTGFNFDEALQQATRSIEPYPGKTSLDYRSIIKYAISLFKIRGTRQFFEVMFRLYDLDITIVLLDGEDPFQKDHTSRFDLEDSEYDKKVTFDNYYRCQNCSDVTFNITPPPGITSQSTVLSFTNQVRSFIERFVPFYINPIINVVGHNTLNQVNISLNRDAMILNSGETSSVQVNVTPVVTGNTLVPLTYQVAVVPFGETPTEEDWSLQSYSELIYPIYLGNKTYWFRPTAEASKGKTVKLDVTEQYINSSYMIWVESPEPNARTLSKDKTKVTIKVKAEENRMVYRNGVLASSTKSYPIIQWDNTGKLYENGTAEVEVDYYGEQVFSINSYRSRKAKIYIDATEEYKKELDTLNLILDPPYLLIKGNSFSKGTSSGTDTANFTPGIYGSQDGITWEGHEYSTLFKVTNRDGIPQPRAIIYEGNNTSKSYSPEDTFVPFGKGAAEYTFYATLNDKESKKVTLSVLSNVALNPVISSIDVTPNPLEFIISSQAVTKRLYGKVWVIGLTKNQAKYYQPKVIMSAPGHGDTEINAVYDSMEGSKAVYTFEVTHSENRINQDYNITFRAGNKSLSIRVRTYQSITELYISPALDQSSQWSGVNTSDPRQNKSLTFTAKPGSSIARFTIEGSGTGVVTGSNGQTYPISPDPGSYSEIEVNGDTVITLTDSNGETLTLTLKDFPAEVSIFCTPTKATITAENPVVSTLVRGTTNKNEKFRFTINDSETIFSIDPNSNTPEYKFETSIPGTYRFKAVDDVNKEATFVVDSNLITEIMVTPNELSWRADETSTKIFQIVVPKGVQVTITEETL